MKFRFKKSSRTTAGLLAGAAFIVLAIHSWGLSVTTALLFLGICFVFLIAIVSLAAILGYIIQYCKKSPRDDK